jgi:hypothetical protein
VLENISASPIVNIDLGAHGELEQHPPGRYAPYDTYSSAAAVWALKPGAAAPPSPIFSYSDTVPAGTPVSSVAIPFSGTSNVLWHYSTKLRSFQRYYGLNADVLADGVQNTAANVIVQYVQVFYGPWVENSEGGLEVQATLFGTSGQADVFRSGVEVPGTWQRASLASPTQYLDSSGQPIALQPGQTWVELVPSGIPVTTLPPDSATTTTTTSPSF